MPEIIDNRTTYNRGGLISIWVLSILASIPLTVFAVFQAIRSRQIESYSYYYNGYYYGSSSYRRMIGALGLAASIIAIAFAVLSIAGHIIQIVLYSRSRLDPRAFYGMELSRCILCIISFFLVIAALAVGNASVAVLPLEAVSLMICIASITYSAVIFDRSRRETASDYGVKRYNPTQQNTDYQAYPQNTEGLYVPNMQNNGPARDV